MYKQKFSVSSRQDGPRRVVLRFQDMDIGTGVFELPPLGAAWLAGQLVAAALEVLNEGGRLGASPDGFAPMILWENWGAPTDSAAWCPQFLSSVRDINREIARCRAEGTPYRLTVDLVNDPLEPATKE